MRVIVNFKSGPANQFAPELSGELINVQYGAEAHREAFVVTTSSGAQLYDAASGMMLNHDLDSWAEMNKLSSFEMNDFEKLANAYMYKRTGGWKTGGQLIDSLNSCPVINTKPYKIIKTIKQESYFSDVHGGGIYSDDEVVSSVTKPVEALAEVSAVHAHTESLKAERQGTQLDFFSSFGM